MGDIKDIRRKGVASVFEGMPSITSPQTVVKEKSIALEGQGGKIADPVKSPPVETEKDYLIQQSEDPKEIDLHQFVHRSMWPVFSPSPQPSLAPGRTDLEKTLPPIRASEQLVLSVDRHCKALDVPKSEWLRYAIKKVMQEEQDFFFHLHNEKK